MTPLSKKKKNVETLKRLQSFDQKFSENTNNAKYY